MVSLTKGSGSVDTRHRQDHRHEQPVRGQHGLPAEGRIGKGSPVGGGGCL